MDFFSLATWTMVGAILHAMIQLVIMGRVIMSRRGVGETLSWVMVVLVLPIVGPLVYLLIGELRLGRSRVLRVQKIFDPIRRRLNALDRPQLHVHPSELGHGGELVCYAGYRMLQVPALPGNRLELLGDWNAIFDRLIADIDAAKINCDIEFYIWHSGGRSAEVVAALQRARKRGVACRILVDAIGSQAFLRSHEATQLRDAGAQIQAALPGGLWRILFIRFDLRMHRKIVLIDDQIAWTGSFNLIDPRFFKREAKVGQWIDAMVRMQGPAVEALAITFQSDWHTETSSADEDLPDLTGEQPLNQEGSCIVQVLPSGPANRVEAIEQVLLTAIYSARKEIVITSPYFVPSESLQMALASAAQRGVQVTVIVPKKVDSILVRYASRAFKGYLLHSGVAIALYHGGLLHTKSVTIDRQLSLFGSLNMDPRSLRLNFEVTLAIYDVPFAEELRQLQQSYIAQSEWMHLATWETRSHTARFIENIARLLGPLL
ncbi:MAG: cardiolipin synthase [Pirellulales bacterium]